MHVPATLSRLLIQASGRWPGVLAILAGFIFAMREKVPGHYLTWLDAAQRLWREEQAYGVSLLTGPFLYSPTFGAFFLWSLSSPADATWTGAISSANLLGLDSGR